MVTGPGLLSIPCLRRRICFSLPKQDVLSSQPQSKPWSRSEKERDFGVPTVARCYSKEFPIITYNSMNLFQPQNFQDLLNFITSPCICISSKSILFLANICKFVWCGNLCLNKKFVWFGQFPGRGCILNQVVRNPTKGPINRWLKIWPPMVVFPSAC